MSNRTLLRPSLMQQEMERRLEQQRVERERAEQKNRKTKKYYTVYNPSTGQKSTEYYQDSYGRICSANTGLPI